MKQSKNINLQTFKTTKCSFQHDAKEYPYYYNCDKFHSNADFRRIPLLKIQQNKTQLKYKGLYLSDNFSEDTCRNWIQYLYHPDIYKTLDCIEGKKCERKFCGYWHEGQPRQHISPKKNQKGSTKQNYLMKQINELKELKQGNFQNQSMIEEERKKILLKKEMLEKRDEEDNQKAVNIKKHMRQFVQNQKIQRRSSKRQFTEFVFGYQLDILQDRHHEFKMFKNKDARAIASLVLEYICAFLNSQGGTIYLGVSDDSVVQGLQVSQKWIDQLLLAIDNNGKIQMNPPLIPQKYQVKIIPVKNRKRLWLNVIEIKVFPPSTNKHDRKILNLYHREGYIRMNASNHRLSAQDIMEYMRLNNNNKMGESLEQYEEEIEEMDENELKKVQGLLNKLNQKIEGKLKKKEVKKSD